ncbi:DUF4097 family beta strand repeat-containing protein [Leuconostoc inhae]|uniref:DUF4097 family beta strand repeat-containing protein n=1 Tax=Leuconostoc inhae TaxID=178001 RepID=UPI001C7D20CB|nr:DUF4097 family beta strand repeat-containing protein [Leuconostoc inhae]
MKRKTIIGWSLLAVGVVMATSAALIEKPGTVIWDNGFSYQKEEAVKTDDLSHQLPKNAQDIQKITVNATDTDVYVQQGDTFAVTETHGDSKNKAKISFSNNELKIEKETTGYRSVSFVWGQFDEDASPRLTITVPRHVKLNTVAVTQSDSDVTMADVSADTINVKSDNGDVNLVRVTSQNTMADVQNAEANLHNVTIDKLRVKLNNDDLTLAGSSVKTLEADLKNGDADIEHSKIEIGGHIRNQNGDISIETTQLPTFSTHNTIGDVEVSPTLTGQQQGNAALVIQNQNGDIEIE